jgi:hypothetical protein
MEKFKKQPRSKAALFAGATALMSVATSSGDPLDGRPDVEILTGMSLNN